MDGVFPDKDFVAGNWRPLQDLADNFSGPFPAADAIDLDAVKGKVCCYRGYRLCSADAVTVAADGRIYFIEFKDVERNPIAQLKKKAFDSLLIFWLAIGRKLSMEEIRSRAVFWYVVPDDEPTSISDELIFLLDDVSGIKTEKPQSNQLEELRSTGLYADVENLKWSQFSDRMTTLGVASSYADFLRILSQDWDVRNSVCNCIGAPVDSIDFKTAVLPFVSLRTMIPYDRLTNVRDLLRLADGCDTNRSRVTINHDWTVAYPVMELAAKCFDTFVVWSAAFHPEMSMKMLAGKLLANVYLTGTSPSFAYPHGTQKFVRDFYDLYSRRWPDRFGLSLYEDERFYARVEV